MRACRWRKMTICCSSSTSDSSSAFGQASNARLENPTISKIAARILRRRASPPAAKKSASALASASKRFARRAFRRPVTKEEIEPFVQLVLAEQIEPVTRLADGIRDLRYRLYEGKWSKLPDFDALKPVAEGALPGQRIDIGLTERKEYFGIVFEGKIDAYSIFQGMD